MTSWVEELDITMYEHMNKRTLPNKQLLEAATNEKEQRPHDGPYVPSAVSCQSHSVETMGSPQLL